jgi:hypothetical protein
VRGRKARHEARREEAIARHADERVLKRQKWIWDEAWYRGKRAALEAMSYPVGEGRVGIDGRRYFTAMIPFFPNPRERRSFEVYFPELPPDLVFSSVLDRMSERERRIRFRPIAHRMSIDSVRGVSSLEWYSWEPDRGGEDIEKRTKVMFQSLGRLKVAAGYMRSTHPAGATWMLQMPLMLLDEAVRELEGLLGEFEVRPSDEDQRVRQELCLP